MTAPAVAVCGFGRCGSTMAMAMLDAGGCPPVAGVHDVSFELADIRTVYAPGVVFAGHAVKLLSAAQYHGMPQADDWRILWLDRNPRQQALSSIKFLSWTTGREAPPHLASQLERSFITDRPASLALLRTHGLVLTLDFESVLRDPGRAARRMRAALWPDLDVDAAAAAVHKRDGSVRPDLAFEAGEMAGA